MTRKEGIDILKEQIINKGLNPNNLKLEKSLGWGKGILYSCNDFNKSYYIIAHIDYSYRDDTNDNCKSFIYTEEEYNNKLQKDKQLEEFKNELENNPYFLKLKNDYNNIKTQIKELENSLISLKYNINNIEFINRQKIENFKKYK